MAWHWPILASVGNAVGFFLLSRNPDFKQLIGAKEREWLVNAAWFAAQYLVSFMLICNFLLGSHIKDKCKNSLLLNVFLTYVCLVVPAVIDHLAKYPELHIKVKDVKQHNSLKRNELFAASSFAISSWGLSKTYELSFESGFFSVCLEYTMIVSLEIVDKTGNNRDRVFILGTYGFCFLLILWRKYLEKNQGNDTTRQRDDQSPDNANTEDQSPNNTNRANRSPFTTSNTDDLQANDIEPTGRLALDQSNQSSEITPSIFMDGTSGAWMVSDGSNQRHIRQERWDVNEQNWECVPPSLCTDTSTNSADSDDGEKEDVPSETNSVVKEGKDIIIHSDVRDCFAEGTSASDDRVGKREEIESLGEEISHGERDMRSSTSSGHMEMASSSGFGRYEKDDVPLFRPKSNNITDSETQIVNIGLGLTEKGKDQSQKSDTQGYEIDDNPLLPKSSLKVDKDDGGDDDDSDCEPFDGKGSDGDDFHRGTRCKLGVCRRHKDTCQESDYQEQGSGRPLRDDISGIDSGSNLGEDILLSSEYKNTEIDLDEIERSVDPQDWINYEGIGKPLSSKETSKLSDNKGSKGDDFNSGAGCEVGLGQREKNKCLVKEGKDITNSGDLPAGCTETCFQFRARSAKIGEENDGDDFNSGWTGRNECPPEEGQDIKKLEALQKVVEEMNTVLLPANQFGNTEIPPEDGYTWRKYGQKEILGSIYPRSYYRCTHMKLYACPAKKQVQRVDDKPNLFAITYRGNHTCPTKSAAAPPPFDILQDETRHQLPVHDGCSPPCSPIHGNDREKLIVE